MMVAGQDLNLRPSGYGQSQVSLNVARCFCGKASPFSSILSILLTPLTISAGLRGSWRISPYSALLNVYPQVRVQLAFGLVCCPQRLGPTTKGARCGLPVRLRPDAAPQNKPARSRDVARTWVHRSIVMLGRDRVRTTTGIPTHAAGGGRGSSVRHSSRSSPDIVTRPYCRSIQCHAHATLGQ